MKSLLAPFLIALAASAILVPLTRIWFIRLGKLDHPDPRKMHRLPVPRSGGIALLGAYWIAVGAFMMERYSSLLERLIPAIAIIGMTGLFDDWLNLNPRYKLLGQFLAASFAYWAGIRLFDAPPGMEWFAFLATAFWLILCSNAFNLTDGTDGLAGTLAVLSSIGIITVAIVLEYDSLAIVFTPMLGATLPFLRANWPPASLFLGDTGSLTLGFLIGCGGAALARHFPNGEGITAAILILTLPLMEVVLSSARRLLRGQSIFKADSFHIHHQLKRQGHGDSAVLLRLAALSLAGTTIAVVQIWLHPILRVALLIPFLIYLGFKVSRLRYPEFTVLWEAIVGGRIRSWFRHQILLRTLEEDLSRSQPLTSLAALLSSGARQLGLLDLNLKFPGHESAYENMHENRPSYWIRIELPGRCWVNFRVPVHWKRTENPASDFAALIIRSFPAERLESFRQAALESDRSEQTVAH